TMRTSGSGAMIVSRAEPPAPAPMMATFVTAGRLSSRWEARRAGVERARDASLAVFTRMDNRRGLAFALFTQQSLHLMHELFDVLELTVHRREPHVGDLIELMEFGHDFFAHHAAWH